MDIYWDDINDYEPIPPFDDKGRLPDDKNYGQESSNKEGDE